MRRHTLLFDTHGAVAGRDDPPHPSIGFAQRVPVTSPGLQSQVLAVTAIHRPDAVLVDEVMTRAGADELVRLGQRGVQVIASVGLRSLDEAAKSSCFCDLFRLLPHCAAVEVIAPGRWIVHACAADSIAALVRPKGGFVDAAPCELCDIDFDRGVMRRAPSATPT